MNIKLQNGHYIPQLGFGTWRSKGEDCYHSVLHALKTGYRHIDGAAIYGNEEQVGKAMRDSGLLREDIFLTTKLWNASQGYESCKAAFEESLSKLGVDYVDLYLIHWPKSYEKTRDSWRAMEELVAEGKIKSIGVSNFKIHHLENLLEVAKIKPVVNQVECNVFVQNVELHEYCDAHNIVLQAYAPLGSNNVGELLSNSTIVNIAHKHNVAPSNVALKYLMQKGIIVLPKSITPSRIEENFNVFGFELNEIEMNELLKLNEEKKSFPDPDTIDF